MHAEIRLYIHPLLCGNYTHSYLYNWIFRMATELIVYVYSYYGNGGSLSDTRFPVLFALSPLHDVLVLFSVPLFFAVLRFAFSPLCRSLLCRSPISYVSAFFSLSAAPLLAVPISCYPFYNTPLFLFPLCCCPLLFPSLPFPYLQFHTRSPPSLPFSIGTRITC